jgi:hypothetical protein
MKNLRIAVAVVAGAAAFAPNGYSQAAQKPSPYSGVSQPPPDDTITTDSATTPAPTLATRPEAAPAAPTVNAAAPTPAAPVPTAVVQPSANCNPDDRMMGDPDPCTTPAVETISPAVAAAAARSASLEADADIVTSVPSRPGELPEGTIIKIALNEELATGESQAGSDFTGRVAADVVSSGKVVIPQGSEVVGKIVRVTEGKRFGSPATIRLRPDVVILPDGSRYVLRAQILATSSKSRVDGEGALLPASRVKTNVIKETAGMGTGAVAGAIIGGPAGALVGTLIGAGVMTTNILVQNPASVKVPKDSTLTMSLTQPMMITPELASTN